MKRRRIELVWQRGSLLSSLPSFSCTFVLPTHPHRSTNQSFCTQPSSNTPSTLRDGGKEYVFVANVNEFVEEPEEQPQTPHQRPICKTITLDETKSITVYKYNNKFYASNAKCPHESGLLCKGSLYDITDMGIVWGTAVQCPMHNWSFNLDTGQCDKSIFVLDIYNVKEQDGQVWVCTTASNESKLVKRRPKKASTG